MLDTSNLKKNIGLNVVLKPIAMLLSFAYIPLIISFIGEEKYGVWATISSFVSWINLCDIGIGNGLKNVLSESIARKEYKKSKELISTAYVSVALIVIFIIIIYSVIAYSYSIANFLNINLQNDNIDFAMWLSVVFVCINFILSVINTILSSLQMPAYVSVGGVLIQLVNMVLILLGSVFLPGKVVIVAILFNASSIMINILISLKVFQRYSYLVPDLNFVRKDKIKEISRVGFMLFVGQICSQIMNSSDNLLIAKLLGPVDVTPYSIAYKLFMIFILAQGVIIMPLWPAYTVANVDNNYKWIRDTLKKGNYLVILLSVGVLFLTFFIKPITTIWLRRELIFDNLMIGIMSAYTIIYLFENNYCSYLCGASIIREYTLVALLGAVLNIPLSIIFTKYLGMGVSGIILGTLVSILPGLIIYPYVTYKQLNRQN